jgi:LacI family transcriptional regulator
MTAVTLKDVARAAGIHYSTASRALDPSKQRLVNAATAAHVRAVAAELGYRQHMVARSLRRGRTNTVGIVVPDLANPTWAPVLHGVTSALEQRGYLALVGETGEDHRRYQRLLDRLASWRVDAVISAATKLADAPYLRQFSKGGVPIILVVRTLPTEDFVSIGEDSVQGAAMATKHLIELGHRLLGQLQGPTEVQIFQDRSQGFLAEAARHPVEVLDFRDAATSPNYNEGYRLMGLLLDRFETAPTGVFAHNDLMAIGAIDALVARGIHCPGDVSVIGYNDSPLVDHVSPALSTIRLPATELGLLAGESVIKLLERGEPPPVSALLAPTLVARASTGPPRST